MQRFALSIGSILAGLALGLCFKWHDIHALKLTGQILPRYIVLIRSIAFLGLNPLLLILVFWIVDWSQAKMVAVPLLGLVALVVGGLFGIVFSRLLKHDSKSTGSMFAAGSFSNLGIVGGIVNFMFFGEIGIVYVTVYKMFEDMYNYIVGYPIVNMYAHIGSKTSKKVILHTIITDPYVFLYVAAFTIGTALNIGGVKRPEVFGKFSEGLILLTTLMMVTSVGYSLCGGKIKQYCKESVCISSIKFFLVPLLIISCARMLGLQRTGNGVLFQVIAVVSFSPPAFNSLIAPQIYGLNTDLSSSCWIVCNFMYLVLIVPLLALALHAGVL